MKITTAYVIVFVAVIAAFTFTAYHFGKWWIILFSLLISPSLKYHTGDEEEDE